VILAARNNQTILYILVTCGKPCVVMDTLLSFLNGDLSIWGVIAVPVGVAICFGPALVTWLKAEIKTSEKDGESR